METRQQEDEAGGGWDWGLRQGEVMAGEDQGRGRLGYGGWSRWRSQQCR